METTDPAESSRTEPLPQLDLSPRRSPHATNARLLAEGNVADTVLPGGIPGMAVLGHEALKDFLTHPEVTKNPEHFTALQEGRIPENWPMLLFTTVPGMHTADGAKHRRLRSLISKEFTARRVEELRPRIEGHVSRLLDGLAAAAAAAGDGVVDLHPHFALPLPLEVICELFGVDEEYRQRMHELTEQTLDVTGDPEPAALAYRELTEVVATVVVNRTREPGDDLTSALIALREEDGDRLSEDELNATIRTSIIAGHETTMTLISNAVRALCGHREQLDTVRSGGASWGDVVEETLRWDAPISYFPFRYPKRDLVVDGTLIPKGTPVLAGYSAAGRDKAAHGADADRFDVTRAARESAVRHLSLGHGAHFCVGAHLGRTEAEIALRSLFARFPELDLAVPEADLLRHPSPLDSATDGLPVRLGTEAG
ncbi:cytochrome P450 family protein [Streptomyces clavuligerus]|nr:cytochrome P450 [Streptomyces clavuligerus]ANW22160.1 cytochrome [Streptomyces clavuligerus]AXU17052.1 cytochrome P450 [Streptomyces clavuligerus]EDY47800.1 cytochrome P450 hydroxylase [Streptomyces clavuligerus]MBY6307307.1 cytochrome P450 [Streptomyces clavuligerus]QCS10123.1 cytochrome P450 [Streptomyces clavuligerus]